MLHLIKTTEDVKSFFKVLQLEKINFHPDDNFADYLNMETGKPTYNQKQIAIREEMVNKCFDVCRKERADIYSLAMEVFNPNGTKRGALLCEVPC